MSSLCKHFPASQSMDIRKKSSYRRKRMKSVHDKSLACWQRANSHLDASFDIDHLLSVNDLILPHFMYMASCCSCDPTAPGKLHSTRVCCWTLTNGYVNKQGSVRVHDLKAEPQRDGGDENGSYKRGGRRQTCPEYSGAPGDTQSRLKRAVWLWA